MTCINLFRNSAVRNLPSRGVPTVLDSIAWGKINLGTTASPLVFGAILIVCSLAVGCSSEKPKTESASIQSPAVQTPLPAVTSAPVAPVTPTAQAASKPAPRKVVRKAPATVTYADKTSGVSFQYPRRYPLKTGEAADELISSDPMPMDFVQPGGGAIAAVMIPSGMYPKSDLAAASFDVSVNKTITSEQCGEFSDAKADSAKPADSAASNSSRLMIGDMELQSAETLTSNGSLNQASRYYHVFENGACYEFALKVATTGVESDEGGKRVDREEVFKRLEKILATVKIHSVEAADVTASAPAASSETTAH